MKHQTPLALLAGVLSCATVVSNDEYSEAERSHWAYQVPQRTALRSFDHAVDRAWAATPIDAIVLGKLREKGLSPAPPADRRTLVRRAYFDLLGLPPTPAEVESFLADRRPDAWERLVDRLLADPRYGEQSGRHWLDVVRFAETEGFEYDRHRPGAWRYRDYVIAAFNADMPYNQFVLEQLAGDEQWKRRMKDEGGRRKEAESSSFILPPSSFQPILHPSSFLTAAGFHRLGAVRRNAGNAEVAFSRNEVLTERTNIIGTAFLGLTVGCARCHDHMFDAIRQTDYYELQAFLASAYEDDHLLAGPAQVEHHKTMSAEIKQEIEKLEEQLDRATGDDRELLMQMIRRAEDRLPPPLPTISTVKNDFTKRTPIHLLDRGDPDRPKQRLKMQFLGVLLSDGAGELSAGETEPKTRLAEFIVNRSNPLTARVMVNRLWQHHFGQGIVATANDFGANGARPANLELLDWLALELLNHDWSIKRIQRSILLSNTYQQSSSFILHPSSLPRTPSSFCRPPRRRLAAEELRDAMLAVSGAMNNAAGGPSVMTPVEQDQVDLLYKPTQWNVAANEREHYRRSVYLIAKRNLRLSMLEVFDQPDRQTTCAARESSTHAPQALELLNGPFANDIAGRLAARLSREAGDDPRAQIDLAFRLAASRPPTPREIELSLAFLRTEPLEEFALAILNLNDFLYVE